MIHTYMRYWNVTVFHCMTQFHRNFSSIARLSEQFQSHSRNLTHKWTLRSKVNVTAPTVHLHLLMLWAWLHFLSKWPITNGNTESSCKKEIRKNFPRELLRSYPFTSKRCKKEQMAIIEYSVASLGSSLKPQRPEMDQKKYPCLSITMTTTAWNDCHN